MKNAADAEAYEFERVTVGDARGHYQAAALKPPLAQLADDGQGGAGAKVIVEDQDIGLDTLQLFEGGIGGIGASDYAKRFIGGQQPEETFAKQSVIVNDKNTDAVWHSYTGYVGRVTSKRQPLGVGTCVSSPPKPRNMARDT